MRAYTCNVTITCWVGGDADWVLPDGQAAVEVRLQGRLLHARGLFAADAPHPPAVQPQEGRPREGAPEVWGAVPARGARSGRVGGSFLHVCVRGFISVVFYPDGCLSG